MEGAIVRNKNVVWRTIDDKIVIISAEALATYVLNKTAAYIWELCDGTKDPEGISADLGAHFDVLPEEADSDVRETIKKFEEMGLLERS